MTIMGATTLTAIATACGTFVVVVLQGINLKDTGDVADKVHAVEHGVESTQSEIQQILEQNKEALQRQKYLVAGLKDLKDYVKAIPTPTPTPQN